jgi:SAM-dependent methyltransferase
VQVGERVLAGRWLPLTVADFRHPPHGLRSLALRFLVDWLIGGALIGAAIGAALGSAVYTVARRRRPAGNDPVGAALAEATARYRAAPRGLRYFARWKYRLDPCYRRIAALIPDGAEVVDVGTGLGMLPIVLALLPGRRRVLGIEWDAAKLAAARAAAAGLDGVRLLDGDARRLPIPACDAITLVDVLHYEGPAAQRALLRRCAAALRPGGRLLVRECDASRPHGARSTRALEVLAVRLGWNRGSSLHFRAAGPLREDLEALGLVVTVEPLAGPLHPGNVLLCAERPAPGPTGAGDETDRAPPTSKPS